MVNPFKIFSRKPAPAAVPTISVNDMLAYYGQTTPASWGNSIWDGSKFTGGFGETQLYDLDYWTLRARSEQLFNENLYAVGLIKRLITNEIGPGLMPEATPDESIIGVPEDSLTDWAELVEARHAVWSKTPAACDYLGESTWGALSRTARRESLISGDTLVVLREKSGVHAPSVQLIPGSSIRTPMLQDFKLKKGHEIEHGVELDPDGRMVAFYAQQKTGGFKRIAAYGPRTGRKLAWLVYGCEKRHGRVRGVPLLSLVLQSLKEIDRYRDSTQRKAVINSILAMFIKKDSNKLGSLPITGGAVRRDSQVVTDNDGRQRKFNVAGQIPGFVIEELNEGEEPVLKGGDGTDTNFALFEEAVLRTIAWANEIPPEILLLAFSNNYSASQAAINEFKIYLNMIWSYWGETFCTPVYTDWFLSEVLAGKIQAPGYYDAWKDPAKYDVASAWVSVEWYGSIKPSTDMLKQGKGSQILIGEGWSTNARESRTLTGTKFSKNIKRLKQENQQKADAMRPMLELKKEYGEQVVNG